MLYLIICPMVFLAGFIDSIAGGGGLISLPAYMFAGLPVHNAIATNKLSSFMGTSLATYSFAKKGFIKLKLAFMPLLFALAGSAIGAKIALRTDGRNFRLFMLLILPIVAFYVFRTKEIKGGGDIYSEKKTILLSIPISFGVGIYDGFYGPGTGTFLILLLTGFAKMSLNSAAGITKAINLSTNIAALAIYISSGKTIIALGIIAGIFNIVGNYLGTRVFINKGSSSVRPVILIVLVLFFIKLITELF